MNKSRTYIVPTRTYGLLKAGIAKSGDGLPQSRCNPERGRTESELEAKTAGVVAVWRPITRGRWTASAYRSRPPSGRERAKPERLFPHLSRG